MENTAWITEEQYEAIVNDMPPTGIMNSRADHTIKTQVQPLNSFYLFRPGMVPAWNLPWVMFKVVREPNLGIGDNTHWERWELVTPVQIVPYWLAAQMQKA